MSFTRELFPDPDTPVTHVRLPRGKLTSMFLRLFSLAPITFTEFPAVFLRELGTSILFSFERYFLVIEFLAERRKLPSVPWYTTSPPPSPARGPSSHYVIGGSYGLKVVFY